ncbi:unnamed protein product [Brachionus calyciflorus]|uniref:RNA-dependent RNA polymerase n=1 Tax=Brachionus calyciflorus TaxID=104777 RepID=A0A813XU51_9BILA|nr:unnamed protein product [Brachionus calyciflorus]
MSFNKRIRIYSLDNELSRIADEVIHAREDKISFEICDDIVLNKGAIYTIQIISHLHVKAFFEFRYSTKCIDINDSKESRILSLTSHTPMKADLLDTNRNIIGRGCFYRYRTDQSKRSVNPRNFDSNFNPSAHRRPSTPLKTRAYPTPDSSIHSVLQKSYLNQSNIYPTPEKSYSNISLDSIRSLRYSMTTSSTPSQIKHSTPTPSQTSKANHNYNFHFQNGFLNSQPKKYINFNTRELTPELSDDSSSQDEDYNFACNTNLTRQFDAISQLSLDSSEYLELFDSIESVSEVDYPIKSGCKFFAFSLKCDLKNSDFNYKKIRDNIYISEADKLFVSNHAIRKLRDVYNIEYVASFKIELYDQKKKIYEEDLKDLLINGIETEINNKRVKFFFIGNSNSGMREKNFWAIDKASFERINFDEFIKSMANFSQFSSIEKLSKRFSQFFSASRPSITLSKLDFCVIDDENSSLNLCYTDGIGLLRLKTCEEISQKLNLKFTSYIFQVRCAGFKGMLVGFPDKLFDNILNENDMPVSPTIKVIFRESQKKFDSNSLELNIVSWSSYESAPASLNSEFLMVLDGLSGPDFKKYILDLFKKNLDDFEESLIDPKKAVAKLLNSNEITEFNHKYKMILLACQNDLSKELDPKQYKIIRELLIEQTIYNLITKRKLSIQIEKSRYLVGVLDETNCLNEGEIFVSFRDHSGKMEYLNGQYCIVGRTPCYGLSEIRRVKARFVPELSHLENCIIFPKKGDRPLTNMLSGGDLDGDFYFVSWDEHLTNIENSNDFIKYPKSEDKFEYLKMKDLREQLANYYVEEIINDDRIGLWHYYLTAFYDLDRSAMTQEPYLNAVIEINKCIDGVSSTTKSPPQIKKPDWYFAYQELSCLDYLSKKEEKFEKLAEILKSRNFNFNRIESSSEYSVLCCLASMGAKKFIELMSKKETLQGEFLSHEDLKLLVKHKKINLNISSEPIRLTNLAHIKCEYRKYIEEVKKLEAKYKNDNNKDLKMFAGQYEKQVRESSGSKKDVLKAKLTEKFRDYVINLKYSNKEIEDNDLLESIHSLDGYYLRSRVVSLYNDLKHEELFYQIPWLFYDVLCYCKNFCNDKKSRKVSSVLPTLVPFSLSTECTRAFSAKKLANYNKF